MGVLSARLSLVAGVFACVHFADGTRQLAYSPTCEPFPGKRIVLVMVSKEYLSFFRNWLHYAKPHFTENEQLVAIAEDSGATAGLELLANVSDIPYVQVSKYDLLEASLYRTAHRSRAPWLTPRYTNMMRETPDHILRWLLKGCSVLYADIDTVWMKNPFEEIEKAGNHDIYFTDDSGKPDPTLEKWMACGCFLYMNPKPIVFELMRSWSSRAMTQRRNQVALNDALQASIAGEAPVDFAILPMNQFPPGILAANFSDPTIYHANWLKTNKKKETFFRDRSLWTQPNH